MIIYAWNLVLYGPFLLCSTFSCPHHILMHWIKYETHNFSSHFCFFSITEKLVIYFRNIPGILFFLLKCLYAMIIFNIFLLKCFKQSIMEINKTFQHVLSVLYTHVCAHTYAFHELHIHFYSYLSGLFQILDFIIIFLFFLFLKNILVFLLFLLLCKTL